MNQNQRTVIEMVRNIASFMGTQRYVITLKWEFAKINKCQHKVFARGSNFGSDCKKEKYGKLDLVKC